MKEGDEGITKKKMKKETRKRITETNNTREIVKRKVKERRERRRREEGKVDWKAARNQEIEQATVRISVT